VKADVRPVTQDKFGWLQAAWSERLGRAAEYVVIPALALAASLAAFGIFIALSGKDPADLYFYMYQGAFGTWFSWQNTLSRAAPVILTALCTALPAQLGLVIIGGEGALLIGALAATSAALIVPDAPPIAVQFAMAFAGMTAGGLWIALSGALQHYRGVNETISSLLLVYIALAILNHLVEGPMRDPASLNKPSTREIGAANMIGTIPGLDVHWGLVFGIVAAVLAYILILVTWGESSADFITNIAESSFRHTQAVLQQRAGCYLVSPVKPLPSISGAWKNGDDGRGKEGATARICAQVP
jgi:general nucleoside transport system permease protein